MEPTMSYALELRCRSCGKTFALAPQAGCDECFAPLEVHYDLERAQRELRPETFRSRPANMWRYRELLPLPALPAGAISTTQLQIGWTPLQPAPRLARVLGVRELYIKNDAVNFPTLSFKDRVVAVALENAQAFGMKTVACSSTGNLANAVAAQAAALGLQAFIFTPADLEPAKIAATLVYGARLVQITGNYDQVNRLCGEIAQNLPWGIVNVNLRPFYAEGSKTVGYEIAEQLGWELPDALVCPMAGGSLITKIHKSFQELRQLDWARNATQIHGAQATGCSPIATAFKRDQREIEPQKPQTIARSLAIGDPADGSFALDAIRASEGACEDASDGEITQAMRLLAETEGIFAETAGGVTVACAQKLLRQGRIRAQARLVLVITGNGLKTLDAITPALPEPVRLPPRYRAFEDYLSTFATATPADPVLV